MINNPSFKRSLNSPSFREGSIIVVSPLDGEILCSAKIVKIEYYQDFANRIWIKFLTEKFFGDPSMPYFPFIIRRVIQY